MRENILDNCRPTLANELSDFRTPYVMKRSSHKKLLDYVAQNPFEEKYIIDKILNSRADLQKGRVKAELPPEVLEPLYAFGGYREWRFGGRDGFERSVESACEGLIEALEGGIKKKEGSAGPAWGRLQEHLDSVQKAQSQKTHVNAEVNARAAERSIGALVDTVSSEQAEAHDDIHGDLHKKIPIAQLWRSQGLGFRLGFSSSSRQTRPRSGFPPVQPHIPVAKREAEQDWRAPNRRAPNGQTRACYRAGHRHVEVSDAAEDGRKLPRVTPLFLIHTTNYYDI